MNIVETPYGILRWNEEIKAVEVQWFGLVYGSDLRTICEKGLEVIKEKQARYWLSDTSSMKIIDREDQIWLSEDFGPRLTQVGLVRSAVIVPKDELAKMVLSNVAAFLVDNTGLEIGYFDDLAKARSWLSSYYDISEP